MCSYFIKKFDSEYEKNSIVLKVQTASEIKKKSASADVLPNQLSEKKLALIIESLAIYLGPMAAMIVNRSLKKHRNKEELITVLAEKIPNKNEREAFIKSVV